MASARNPTCLGVVHAMIGNIQIVPDVSPRLLLVAGIKEVGSIRNRFEKNGFHKIYCITRVIFLPITTPPDCELNLTPCQKHHTQHLNSHDRKNFLPFGDFQQKVGLSKTFGTIKNVTSTLKTATVNAAVTATGQNKNRKDIRDKERFERRILDELHKMFNESESFFYSDDADLTNSLQRQNDSSYDHSKPLWERADDRFFWNKHMLQEFITEPKSVPDSWLVPVIQGFIQVERVPLDANVSSQLPISNISCQHLDSYYTLALISRRSRQRAGTRYKRRGIDEDGNVANYVETEQIVTFSHHQVAFVQVRGSVPLFWSQPGYKYRPPPRLDKGTEETAVAFRKHFEHELKIYKKMLCISLVEQLGKENVIADAYLDHIMRLDLSTISFISFDFHEYCRGMRYENVSVLVEGIADIITAMSYCWVDSQGIICQQNGIFRVNCIDCLDRTNVVQTALAKAVLETIFAKLGILPPDFPLPQNCRSTLQVMWANNGDAISKQYAGTSALKGDFTRTGERNFAGLMKDGMNSANRYYLNHFQDVYRQAAIDILQYGEVSPESLVEIGYLEQLLSVASTIMPNNPPQYMADIALSPEKHFASAVWAFSRYYLNRFKDAYRQATIDTMLGNPVAEDIISLNPEVGVSEEEEASVAQHVKHVIDDCKKLLVPDAETILGAWGLIDADPTTGDPDQTDMDIILVLTRDSYYVAQYDEEADRIMRYERVSLIDLDRIEVGPYIFQGVFKQSRTHFCIRFSYQVEGQTGYYHTFRSMNIRFFNNMAVAIKTEEEIIESMKAIGDTFEIAVQMIGCEVEVFLGKLEKLKSRGRLPLANPFQLLSPITNFTKSSPDSLKSVGTRAINNMTSGLARLNPMASLRIKRTDVAHKTLPNSQFYLQPPSVSVIDSAFLKPRKDLHVESCGILASSFMSADDSVYQARSPALVRSLSDANLSFLSKNCRDHSIFPNRARTPEILISEEKVEMGSNTHGMQTTLKLLHSSLKSARMRKLSHSSDDVDMKEEESSGIQRASSATELDLKLPLGSQSDVKSGGGIFASPLSPLSPLASFNKETVLAPFSVLARGVQSLAPGAGKLARGVQNIGVSRDPQKLKAQRQKQFEADAELQARKLKCLSRIIQF